MGGVEWEGRDFLPPARRTVLYFVVGAAAASVAEGPAVIARRSRQWRGEGR